MTKQPDFLIVGCQRGGTTSLYNYLIFNPEINPTSKKEIHFFDNNFDKGISWYYQHFLPDKITGEATPYYLFHPHAAKRISKLLPNVKIIILLRDPVARAYSHYSHEVSLGVEKLSFKDAIQNETSRLEGELEKMLQDETYYSFNHQHFSYLERGKYVEQLKNWFSFFNNDQILIIQSEKFFNNPNNVLATVYEFLKIPKKLTSNLPKFNQGNYSPIDVSVQKYLNDFFSPYNEELYSYLNQNFGW